MNARLSFAAAVFALTLTASSQANDNPGRSLNFNVGNSGFNVEFRGNDRNVFRQTERVLRAESKFRREANDLPFKQRFVLLRLSTQVNQRTEQLIFALRNDNRRLAETRARQLLQTVNQIEFVVDQLPRNRNDVRDVRRAFDNLEDDVRDLVRSL